LSLATINKIERALVYPRPNTLSKLAAALGVTPADLLRGEGDK
jgi:transcriptional regulator with XRE-family HTH domain